MFKSARADLSTAGKKGVCREMTPHFAKNRPIGVVAGAARLTLVTLALVIPGIASLRAADANAMAVHGSLGWGDGDHKKKYVAVNSPTIMRGAQQVSVSISDKTRTQASFCKRKVKFCRISQRMGN
ncbi:hypothetical protein ABZ897_62320 [Nonomuraea sp. NPDC046802]|uniref:hypothetical protein n=1 Tax=Nonomuraea sp. NPDC046802 TaxID=3154919 RepID=UPI0033DC9BA4